MTVRGAISAALGVVVLAGCDPAPMKPETAATREPAPDTRPVPSVAPAAVERSMRLLGPGIRRDRQTRV